MLQGFSGSPSFKPFCINRSKYSKNYFNYFFATGREIFENNKEKEPQKLRPKLKKHIY